MNEALGDDPSIPIESYVPGSNDDLSNPVALVNQHSINLVKFLIEKVPGFVQVAEDSRMDYKSIPFAKQITSVFGRENYRLIVTATEENAAEVLAKLKSVA